MTRSSGRSLPLGIAALTAISASAHAQVVVHAGVSPAVAVAPIVARASRPDLPADLVTAIASQAEARKLSQQEYPDLPNRTAEEVLRTFCGTVTDAHRAAYRHENGLPDNADLNAPLGPDAYKRGWPACLYVAARPTQASVEEGRSLSDLYLGMTGKAGDRKAILAFFGLHSSIVHPGQPVTGQYLSLPSELVAKAGSDLSSLLISPAAAAVPSLPKPQHRPGEIIVARSSGVAGQPYVRPVECSRVGDFKIATAALNYAFSLSASAGHDSNEVKVLVADNGFFGGSLSNGRMIFAGHFDRRVFHVRADAQGADSIGPQVDDGNGPPLYPVLDKANVAHLDEVSGHGTHVTGLVLGGSALGLESGLFDIPTAGGAPKYSWLSLSEYPLSAGTEQVSSQAFKSITQIGLLDADIVNMSVRYGADVASAMPGLLSSRPMTLFVAAAGNDGQPVTSRSQLLESSHPAADGGPLHPNVISVAAEDGAGYLTSFTNFGDKEVDIAAPGCNVGSWLDGVQSATLSGTSQAAPLVTMTAALLARRGLTAPQIKRRILLSGDLLKGTWSNGADGKPIATNYDDRDPSQIVSRSRLDIVKALYFPLDYVDFDAVPPGAPAGAAKVRYRILGTISFSGKAWCDRDENDAASLLAAKRAGDILWCFENGPLAIGQGSFEADATASVTATHALKPDGTEDPSITTGTAFTPATADIHEFILSDINMTSIQGQ